MNYPFKYKKLKNLWDQVKLEPFETYCEFFRMPENISFQKKQKCISVWKKYKVGENSKLSLFNSMERIKLITSTIQRSLNLDYLIQNKIIEKCYCINDNYELSG
jgi:NAD+--asparagine ADP-ribosyltransferase